MNSADQAVIVIHRPTNYFFGGSRSFIVWIDGRRAGKVKRGAAAEFAVEPGEHTVSVTMDWLRSRPLPVVAAPGSRIELAIGGRSWSPVKQLFMLLPGLIAILVTVVLIEVLRATVVVVDTNWWLRMVLFIAIYLALFGGYLKVTKKFSGDYWDVLTLEPTGTGLTQTLVGG